MEECPLQQLLILCVRMEYQLGIAANVPERRLLFSLPSLSTLLCLLYVHSDWDVSRWLCVMYKAWIRHWTHWRAQASSSSSILRLFYSCIIKDKSKKERKYALLLGHKWGACASVAEPEGHPKDDLSFKMLLGRRRRNRFPSISVSVTLLLILIKYVSHPQASTADFKRKVKGEPGFFLLPNAKKQIIMRK